MIISLVSSKGGAGKSTLAHCIGCSSTLRSKFGAVGLIDLDPQGTLSTVFRDREGPPPKGISFAQVLGERPANEVRAMAKKCKALVLDVPGHQGFALKYAVAVSDLVVIPCRATLPDEAALAEVLWPHFRAQAKTPTLLVVPSMVHAKSNPATHAAYFRELLPKQFKVSAVPFFSRSIFENYHRDGLTLSEYSESVKGNQRARSQCDRAIADIENLTREILKHGAA